MTAKPYGLRDRIAIAACNWALSHVATDRCRKMISGAIRYGMAAADRDEREGIPMPCHVDRFSAEIRGDGSL
jgi:hypothetical protein